jgi:hypothetical protein
MGYRNLTNEEFAIVKNAAKKVCEQGELKTIRDFRKIGNEIIDEIESGNLKWKDLLQPVIPYTPK